MGGTFFQKSSPHKKLKKFSPQKPHSSILLSHVHADAAEGDSGEGEDRDEDDAPEGEGAAGDEEDGVRHDVCIKGDDLERTVPVGQPIHSGEEEGIVSFRGIGVIIEFEEERSRDPDDLGILFFRDETIVKGGVVFVNSFRFLGRDVVGFAVRLGGGCEERGHGDVVEGIEEERVCVSEDSVAVKFLDYAKLSRKL